MKFHAPLSQRKKNNIKSTSSYTIYIYTISSQLIPTAVCIGKHHNNHWFVKTIHLRLFAKDCIKKSHCKIHSTRLSGSIMSSHSTIKRTINKQHGGVKLFATIKQFSIKFHYIQFHCNDFHILFSCCFAAGHSNVYAYVTLLLCDNAETHCNRSAERPIK